MTTVAQLTIEMAANVARLRVDMARTVSVVDTAMTQVSRSASMAKSSLAGIVSAVTIGQIVQMADSVTVLSNRLKLATGSAEAAQRAMSGLFDVAQMSRASYTELGATMAVVARSTQSLNLSESNLLRVTGAIGNAMAITGGSAQSMNAALVQLGQGLGSGTLRGQELNSIMEQTPRLAQAIADGLGIALGQLRKYAEEGKLTTEAVTAALLAQSKVLEGEVKGSIMSVSSAWQMLMNSATKTIGVFDKTTGTTSFLAAVISKTSGEIDRLTKYSEELSQRGVGGLQSSLAVLGMAMGRSTFGAISASAESFNYVLNGVTGGVLKLSEKIDIMPRMFQSSSEQIQTMAAQIVKAEAEYAVLAKRLEQAPNNIYIKSDIANLVQYIEKIRQARGELIGLQQASSGPAGSGSVGSPDRALDRLQRAAYDKLDPERKKFLSDARTDAQKLKEELEKASVAFGGLVPANVEQNIREKFTKTAASAGKTVDEYARLIKSIQDKSAVVAQEIALGDKLTESEHMALKLRQDLKDGTLKLTAAQQAQALQDIAALANNEALLKTKKNQIEYEKELLSFQEQTRKELEADRDLRMRLAAEGVQSANDYVKLLQEQNAESKLEISLLGTNALQREIIIGKRRIELELIKQIAAIDGNKGFEGEVAREEQRAKVRAAALEASIALETDLRTKEAVKVSETYYDAIYQAFTGGGTSALKKIALDIKNTAFKILLDPILKPIAGGLAGLLGGSNAAFAQGANGGGGGILSSLGSLLGGGAGGSGGLFGGLTSTLGVGTGIASAITGGLSAGFGGLAGSIGSLFGAAGTGATLGGAMSAGSIALGAGNIAGGLATFAGALGPIALGLTALKSLFKKKLVDSGIQGEFGGDDGFVGSSFTTTKRKFSSSKTKFGAIDEELRSTLATQFGFVKTAVIEQAGALNLNIDAIEAVRKSFKLSTKGLNETQIQQALEQEIKAVSDALADSVLGTFVTVQEAVRRTVLVQTEDGQNYQKITEMVERTELVASEFARAGESSSDTLARLSSSLVGVNQVFEKFNLTLFQASVSGGDRASSFIDKFGGRDAFAQLANSYYEKFYSDAERLEKAKADLTSRLSDLGVNSNIDRAGFRSAFESAVNSSDDALSASLLQLAPAFDAVAAASEEAAKRVQEAAQEQLEAAERVAQEQIEAANRVAQERAGLEDRLAQMLGMTALLRERERELAALAPGNRYLQERIYSLEDLTGRMNMLALVASEQAEAASVSSTAVQSSLEAGVSIAQALRDEMQALFDSLGNSVKTLRQNTEQASAALYAQARAQITAALQSSRAGFGLPDPEALQGSVEQALSGLSKQQFTTAAEKGFVELKLAAELEELQNAAGKQVSNADKQVAALQMQISIQRESAASLQNIGAKLDRLSPEALLAVVKQLTASSEKDKLVSVGGGNAVYASSSGSTGVIAGSGSFVVASDGKTKFSTEEIYNYIQTQLSGANPSVGIRNIYNQAKQYGISSAMIDSIMGYAPGTALQAAKDLGLPAFDVGINYVPRDMPAIIHEGEAVIPKGYNPAAGYTGALQDLMASLLSETSAMRSEIKSMRRGTDKSADVLERSFDGNGIRIKDITPA